MSSTRRSAVRTVSEASGMQSSGDPTPHGGSNAEHTQLLKRSIAMSNSCWMDCSAFGPASGSVGSGHVMSLRRAPIMQSWTLPVSMMSRRSAFRSQHSCTSAAVEPPAWPSCCIRLVMLTRQACTRRPSSLSPRPPDAVANDPNAPVTPPGRSTTRLGGAFSSTKRYPSQVSVGSHCAGVVRCRVVPHEHTSSRCPLPLPFPFPLPPQEPHEHPHVLLGESG